MNDSLTLKDTIVLIIGAVVLIGWPMYMHYKESRRWEESNKTAKRRPYVPFYQTMIPDPVARRLILVSFLIVLIFSLYMILRPLARD